MNGSLSTDPAFRAVNTRPDCAGGLAGGLAISLRNRAGRLLRQAGWRMLTSLYRLRRALLRTRRH
jgi:hypothetical protein